jgi:hypothetical protein
MDLIERGLAAEPTPDRYFRNDTVENKATSLDLRAFSTHGWTSRTHLAQYSCSRYYYLQERKGVSPKVCVKTQQEPQHEN